MGLFTLVYIAFFVFLIHFNTIKFTYVKAEGVKHNGSHNRKGLDNLAIDYRLLQINLVRHGINNTVTSRNENIFLFHMKQADHSGHTHVHNANRQFYNENVGQLQCLNKKFKVSAKRKYIFLNRKVVFFPTIRRAVKYHSSITNHKEKSLLQWINMFDTPSSSPENDELFSIITLNNTYMNDVAFKYAADFEQLIFDKEYSNHVFCEIDYSFSSTSRKRTTKKFLLSPSTKYPAFESQYVYKYEAKDIDHYALNYINVLSTAESNIPKNIIVPNNTTATAGHVIELVETAAKRQQNKIMGKRNQVTSHQYTNMIEHNHMKDTYSVGCKYEGDTFSNCLKQHQNIKACESYRSKLSTCHHLAQREIRFQSTYAKTSTMKASSKQSIRLSRVADALRAAPVATSASISGDVASEGAALPPPPADGGSARDESAVMGPDNSNKAEYIIRHIAELIFQRVVDEWETEGEEKIQEMVPPMLHASDVKGSCGSNLPGHETKMGPFSGISPFFKEQQVGITKANHSNNIQSDDSKKLAFREKEPPVVKMVKEKIKGKKLELEALLGSCIIKMKDCLLTAAKAIKKLKAKQAKAKKKKDEGKLTKKDALHMKKKAEKLKEVILDIKKKCKDAKEECVGKVKGMLPKPKPPPSAGDDDKDGDDKNDDKGGDDAKKENNANDDAEKGNDDKGGDDSNKGNDDKAKKENNSNDDAEKGNDDKGGDDSNNGNDDKGGDDSNNGNDDKGGDDSNKGNDDKGGDDSNKGNDDKGGDDSNKGNDDKGGDDSNKGNDDKGGDDSNKGNDDKGGNDDNNDKVKDDGNNNDNDKEFEDESGASGIASPAGDSESGASGSESGDGGSESGASGTASPAGDSESGASGSESGDGGSESGDGGSESGASGSGSGDGGSESGASGSESGDGGSGSGDGGSDGGNKRDKNSDEESGASGGESEVKEKGNGSTVNNGVLDGDKTGNDQGGNNPTKILENKMNIIHPSNIHCNEECRKRRAEERHKRKIKRLKQEEETRKKPGPPGGGDDGNSGKGGASVASFLSISSHGDGDDKAIEEAEAEEEKKLDKEEKEEEKTKEDEDGKNVEDKIAKFEKAKTDVDIKEASLMEANAKLSATQIQATRMKKKTAAAAQKAMKMTLKLNNARDPEEKTQSRMEAETASEAAGTQIRLSAAFADAVALMAKRAKDAATQLADAKLKKKQAKEELITAEKKKEMDEDFDTESSKALGIKDDKEEDNDDKDDDDNDDDKDDGSKGDDTDVSDQEAYGWIDNANWANERDEDEGKVDNTKKKPLNLTHINLNLRKIKELHCKSAYNLIFVTDNEMTDVFEFLKHKDNLKVEQTMQKMSQMIKYIVLTVFEYRSCSNYMKQMKIENDFEFYDLLQHVKPRSRRPVWAMQYTKPKANKLLMQSNRTLERILFMESEASMLEAERDKMAKKYGCNLPYADEVRKKQSYKYLEKTLIPNAQNLHPAKTLLSKNFDNSKNIFKKPKIKPFDPKHDLKAPYDLQNRAEKVIDDIDKAEQLSSDDVIQSASRSTLVPLLTMKQYLRNNVSLSTEQQQCWHIQSKQICEQLKFCKLHNGHCSPSNDVDRGTNKTRSDANKQDIVNVPYAPRKVLPRRNEPGKFMTDAEQDPYNKPDPRLYEAASFLDISTVHKKPMELPSGQDLFDAHKISDRLGNAGIQSGTGQAHIVLASRGKSCKEACITETDNIQLHAPTELPCNLEMTRRLNNCQEMERSVLCRKGCREIFLANWYTNYENWHKKHNKDESGNVRWHHPLIPRLERVTYPGLAATSSYFNGGSRAEKGTCLFYRGSVNDISCEGKHPGIERLCSCGIVRDNTHGEDLKKDGSIGRHIVKPPVRSNKKKPNDISKYKKMQNIAKTEVDTKINNKNRNVNKKKMAKHENARKQDNPEPVKKQCPDFLIRFDSKVKQITHSQHELSLALQERAIFLRKKALYMLHRAKSVKEIYIKTKGNNKGLYSKELDAADTAIKFDQDATKKAHQRQVEAEKMLQSISKNVSEISREREKILKNSVVSFLQLRTKDNIEQTLEKRMDSFIEVYNKDKEYEKSDPSQSNQAREFQQMDAGVGSGDGGTGEPGGDAGGQCQKGYFVRVITTDLIHTLTTFFVGAFSRHISEFITTPTVDAISTQIEDKLATETADRLATTLGNAQRDMLAFTIPTAIEAVATRPCSVMAVYTIAHLLTRGLTHTLTPTLIHSLSYGDHEETYCYNCHTYGQQCELCSHSDEQTYYASHYSDYYQSYYSDYYADFYIEKFLKDLPPLPEGTTNTPPDKEDPESKPIKKEKEKRPKEENLAKFIGKMCTPSDLKNLMGSCFDKSDASQCTDGDYHPSNCKGPPDRIGCCVKKMANGRKAKNIYVKDNSKKARKKRRAKRINIIIKKKRAKQEEEKPTKKNKPKKRAKQEEEKPTKKKTGGGKQTGGRKQAGGGNRKTHHN